MIKSIFETFTVSPIKTETRRKLDFRAGDTVRVWQKIKEGDKTRLQVFEGLIIARKHGGEPGATFTVRKVSDGVGVERIFPLYSPHLDKIEIVRRAKVRRAKIYYIRTKSVRDIRRKVKQLGSGSEIFAMAEKEEPVVQTEPTATETAVVEPAK